MNSIKSIDQINNRTMGRSFKEMRQRLGISQAALAEKLKIATYNTIAGYESGKTSIPVVVWCKVEWLLKHSTQESAKHN